MRASELQYRELLADELQTVQQFLLHPQRDMPPDLSSAVEALVLRGGKRLRPALVLLSAHICGADVEQTIPLAAAIEMLHTATLIHDDIIDEAPLRRGAHTLNALRSPGAAVLAGDIVFSWAARFAAQVGNPSVMRRFAETLTTICAGELRQLYRRHFLPTVEEYYRRIFAKTASLFALATEVGSMLAGCPPAEVRRWRDIGRLLGEAFQIADDVLDLTGDETALGKPIGGDLRQGIITLPVLRYLEQHPDDDRVKTILYHPDDIELLHAFLTDFRRSEAAEWAIAQARAHVDQALTLLALYPETPYRLAVEEIAHFSVRREH